MTEPAIEIAGLSHAYAGVEALTDIDLTVPRGTAFALLGPNGAGKSTLVRILCTLLQPDRGTVRLDGVDALRQPTEARESIGVVFQDSSLDDRLTAGENLEFHGLVHGMARRDRARRAAEVLELVELADWTEEIVRGFSGGMRRRLEIARALMHEPRILLLDEPTVGLDAQTRQRIWLYLDRLRREGEVTVLITTHYIEEAEDCDAVCIIDRGRIVAQGTPGELRARHGETLLNVLPRDEAARAEIALTVAGAREIEGERMTVPSRSPEQTDAFLGRFGSRLSEVRVEQPSLESVFLAITGRELRDRAGATREAEQADGRRAGRL